MLGAAEATRRNEWFARCDEHIVADGDVGVLAPMSSVSRLTACAKKGLLCATAFVLGGVAAQFVPPAGSLHSTASAASEIHLAPAPRLHPKERYAIPQPI